MSELIIVCGLMGVGKTTFAKQYAEKFNYEYIDFDKEYHTQTQKFRKSSEKAKIQDVLNFIDKVAKQLNNNPDKNFVIDNWFKWYLDWWKRMDNSLEILQKFLLFHKIKVLHLTIPFKEAYKNYVKKHNEDKTLGGINPEYKDTMELRHKNLNERILRWAIQ